MANTSILGLTKPSYTDDADISDLNGNFDLIDAEAGRLRANFAPTYSTSSAYAVGDYVVYTGNLYRCTTAIGSGGESWTAGHWTQVAIGTEVKGLSDQIGTLNGQITGKLFQNKDVSTVSANSSKTYTMTSNDHVALVFANAGDGAVGVWAISFRTSNEIGVSKLSTIEAYSSISTSGMTFTVSCSYLTKVKVVMF